MQGDRVQRREGCSCKGKSPIDGEPKGTMKSFFILSYLYNFFLTCNNLSLKNSKVSLNSPLREREREKYLRSVLVKTNILSFFPPEP